MLFIKILFILYLFFCYFNIIKFQTNYLGHFLLTHLLLPVLKQSAPARIVCLSSIAHIMPQAAIYMRDLNLEKSYGPWKAYCQSKLACLFFAYEMSKRLKGTNITINAVHPGIVDTTLWDTYASYVPFGQTLYNLLKKIFFITPEQGAQTQIYVATSKECATETGMSFFFFFLYSFSQIINIFYNSYY